MNPLASKIAIAIASPKANEAVVLVVGAKLFGQASSTTSVDKLNRDSLAIFEVLDPVIDNIWQPISFNEGRISITSCDSPE